MTKEIESGETNERTSAFVNSFKSKGSGRIFETMVDRVSILFGITLGAAVTGLPMVFINTAISRGIDGYTFQGSQQINLLTLGMMAVMTTGMIAGAEIAARLRGLDKSGN